MYSLVYIYSCIMQLEMNITYQSLWEQSQKCCLEFPIYGTFPGTSPWEHAQLKLVSATTWAIQYLITNINMTPSNHCNWLFARLTEIDTCNFLSTGFLTNIWWSHQHVVEGRKEGRERNLQTRDFRRKTQGTSHTFRLWYLSQSKWQISTNLYASLA